jgi:hypothetical protein
MRGTPVLRMTALLVLILFVWTLVTLGSARVSGGGAPLRRSSP